MPPLPPFVERETERIDWSRIVEEAIPLAELVGLVAVAALVPYALANLMGFSIFGAVLMLVTQFILAVGAGVVLLYVVARGVQLADE